MTNTDLQNLRALCEAATPGPWHTKTSDYIVSADTGHGRQPIVEAVGAFNAAEDATFIALARTALPEALDEIDRLRALLVEACDIAEEAEGDWFGSLDPLTEHERENHRARMRSLSRIRALSSMEVGK